MGGGGRTALSVNLTITTSLKTQFLILSFKSLSEASRFILGEQVWLGDSPVSSQTFPLINIASDPRHTASKLTIVSKFYHIVRKKCDNFRVRYK